MTRTTFKCSSCDKDLAEIVVVTPDDSIVWKISANCCFCGDKSFTKEVKGHIYIGEVESCHIIQEEMLETNSKFSRVLIHTRMKV